MNQLEYLDVYLPCVSVTGVPVRRLVIFQNILTTSINIRQIKRKIPKKINIGQQWPTSAIFQTRGIIS
jgi:hypothetical protein